MLNWMVVPTPIELNVEDLSYEGITFILNMTHIIIVAPMVEIGELLH